MMNMMRKGQIQGVAKGDVRGQVALVARLLEWLSKKIEEGPLTFNFFLPCFCNTT